MSKKDWQRAVIRATTPITEALKVIDDVSLQICLVSDESGKLLGVVTDGDVRRGLLRSVPLNAMVSDIMMKSPTVGHLGDSGERLLDLMNARGLRHLPIVDGEAKIIDLILRDDLLIPGPRPNSVVLMAGGLGARLRPMTEATPKPLLNVGGRPILETILESFIEHRFERFYISVNYKAEMIKDYFGNGRRWNVKIEYLEEKEKLGTAGALSLIVRRPAQPLIVMNGDILTRINYAHLLQFHQSHNAQATMCVREYDFEVPFGVVTVKENRIEQIVEKPVHSFFVNAGIYVIEPDLLDMIPGNQTFDMPELFEKVIARGLNTAAFPIREYWLDIGRAGDFDRANGDIKVVFDS